MAIFEKLVSRAKVLERSAQTGLRAEQYQENIRKIEYVLAISKLIDIYDVSSIYSMAKHHVDCACAALFHEDSVGLTEHLPKAVQLNTLVDRFYAAVPVPDANVIALSYNASTALNLSAPTMLSDWSEGKTCATVLLSASRSEMTRDPDHRRTHSWGRGTVAAFIIEFLAYEYGLPREYSSQVPLAKEYVKLLLSYRTENKGVFEGAMRDAISRHIKESKDTSRFKPPSDFFDDLHKFFPTELLCIKAIRRRDGLPEFDCNHPLLDTPWSLIKSVVFDKHIQIAQRVEIRLSRLLKYCLTHPENTILQ
jgi:hypothetical protein